MVAGDGWWNCERATTIEAGTDQVKWIPPEPRRIQLHALIVLMALTSSAYTQDRKPVSQASSTSGDNLAQLVSLLRGKAKALEGSSGMRLGFQSFASAHKLPLESVRYSDYVLVRLMFEATRDAGFWNLHWAITDQPPNSDRIWKQWQNVRNPSPLESTATAACDELSALYAFLVERAGVKSVGLLWPTPNHTVAVWVVRPVTGPVVRVVVPTSQIFLEESDRFDTKKFDPWRQKTIYEYTRRDVPDSFELPKPLFEFFLQQVDKYGGASDATLQQLRYLREGVFLRSWSPEQAAREALKRRSALGSGPAEDLAALQNFAQDMRSGVVR
jgi:hypothetical protein